MAATSYATGWPGALGGWSSPGGMVSRRVGLDTELLPAASSAHTEKVYVRDGRRLVIRMLLVSVEYWAPESSNRAPTG